MCLAVPMRVVSIEGPVAQVEESGCAARRGGSAGGHSVGDYVIVHAGIAIQRLDEEERRRRSS